MNETLADDPLDLAIDMRCLALRMLDQARRLENRNRARRMEQVAQSLLDGGMRRAEVVHLLQQRFAISRRHAYKVIDRSPFGSIGGVV